MKKEQLRFCNLHQHTTESHLDAICDIDDLFDRAKELGQRAIAVTDHGSMGGTFKAYKAYKRTGVKFIPGNEIYFTPDLEAPAKDPETKERNPQARRYHLVLLAMNEQGYRNLLRVTHEGFKNSVTVMNKEFPRVDEEILRKYSEGIFALSACGGNIIAQSILRKDHDQAICYAKMLKDVYKENFFIELQPHAIKRGEFSQLMLNKKMKEVAEELKVRMVATCDAHYIKQSDEKYHDMVLAISDKKALEDLTRHTYTIDVLCDQCTYGWVNKAEKIKCSNPECAKGVIAKKPCPEFYLKSEEEVLNFFTEHFDEKFANQLVDTSLFIANQCDNPDYIEPSDAEHIPTFDMRHISQCDDHEAFKVWREKYGNGASDDVAYLRYSTFKGFMIYAKKKNLSEEQRKEYWKRAKFEMSVFEARNFCSYMLIVADYIGWARANGVVVGPSRGSASGCLVAFLIGIHRVDPIKYGLYFERFLNLEKKSYPDIDTDFAPSGREKVYLYCRRKYGEDCVAYISNLSRFTPKVALTDIIRSLVEGGDKSKAFRIAKAITAEIPDKVHEGNKVIAIDTIEKALKYSTGTLLRDLAEDSPEIIDFAKKIVGLPRNYSTHAGGVVISDLPLPDIVPMRRDKKGAFAIQYEKNQVEEAKLVKMDMLGLSKLDIISEILEQAKNIGQELPDLDTLCLDETDHKEAFKVLDSGLTTGCFQIEGNTLQPLCKPMKARSIEDIALINALGRPSCSSAQRKSFLARRNGEEKITYPHKLLEGILSKTYGVSIYEEDLLRLAPELAGWNLSEADGLRKITKLKEKGAALAEELEKKFVADCMSHSKIPKKEAQFIWDDVIIPYSLYGFTLAHAIPYSMIGYATAYYKINSRAPFFAATLNSKLKSKSKAQDHDEYLSKVKRDAIKYSVSITACDINKSSQYYVATSKNNIVTGLGAVKGLGPVALNTIISNQPYTSIEHFMAKNTSKVNKNHVESLAKGGAFDSFGVSRKYIFEHFISLRDQWKKYLKKADDSMFEDGDKSKPRLEQLIAGFSYANEDQSQVEWNMQEKLEFEKEVLGEYVSGSPKDLYPGFFMSGAYDTDFKSIVTKRKGDNLLFEGMVTATREFLIKRGQNKGRRMGQITVENLKGESTDMTVWCEQWEKNEKAFLKGDLPVRGQAYVNQDRETKEKSWALFKIKVHSKRTKRTT